jgi:hypothetical protein
MLQFSGSYCTDLAPGDLVQILKDTGVPTVDSCGSSPNPLRIDALAAIDSIGVPGGSGTVFCQGDGSLTPCPCGNESATPIPCGGGAGCVNSSGEGAGAAANGSPSVSADDLIVDGARLLPAQPALCFAGTVQLNGGAGIPFGDGLRCAGASVIRLGTQNADAAGAASWGPGLAATGGWSPGDQRYLQLWYRDPTGSPCGSGFNLSNGLAVSFTP